MAVTTTNRVKGLNACFWAWSAKAACISPAADLCCGERAKLVGCTGVANPAATKSGLWSSANSSFVVAAIAVAFAGIVTPASAVGLTAAALFAAADAIGFAKGPAICVWIDVGFATGSKGCEKHERQ